MPVGFTEGQRERIRGTMLAVAAEGFARVGYKNLSIRDLTEKAGIAPGSFYKFFESKEELFHAVVAEAGDALRLRLRAALEHSRSPKSALMEAVRIIGETLEGNPVLAQLMLKGECGFVLGRLGEDRLEHQRESSLEFFRTLLGAWRDRGMVREEVDIGLAAEAIRSLFFLNLHKSEIGAERFENVQQFMVDSLLNSILGEP